MRSMLMVNAGQELTGETGATLTKAGAVVIDLAGTDFCGGLEQTRRAANTIIARARRSERKAKIYVRVHMLDTQECKEDLEYVMPLAPDGLFLPRCRNGADVQHLAGLLAVLEAKNDLADGSTKIIASAANEASSIFDLKSFQGANRRLIAMSWDAAELANSLGVQPIVDRGGAFLPPLAMARLLMLYAAKAAQVYALDTPAFHATDAESFQRQCEAARRDGFDGKIGLDFTQITAIDQVFAG